MSRRSFHWAVLVFGLAGACTPAAAYTAYSTILSANITDGIYGYSSMQLEYPDIYYDDYTGAGVDTYITLSSDPGDVLGEVSDFENGENGGDPTFAEASPYTPFIGSGTYSVWGDDFAFFWDAEEWIYVDTSSDSQDVEAAVCGFPDEETVQDSGWSSSYGAPVRQFTSSLWYDDFSGRTVFEACGSNCTNSCNNQSIAAALNGVWTVDDNEQFVDHIGYKAGDVATIRSSFTLPCGFDEYQEMWMTCPGGVSYNYQTNELIESIGSTYVTIWKNDDGGTYSY